MNDELQIASHDRSTSKAQWNAKVYRGKALLRRKWWLLLLGGMAGLAIGRLASWSDTVEYVSTGRMIISIKLAIPEGSVYTEDWENFVGTQVALMLSTAVVSRAHLRVAAQRPDLASRQVALKVSTLPKTSIFVLQGTGQSLEYTRAFVQACMEEYISLKKEMRTQTSDTTVAGLTEELLRLDKELRKSDQEMVAFQSTNGVFVSQEQGDSAGSYLDTLNGKLRQAKNEYSLLQELTLDQAIDLQKQTEAAQPAVGDSLVPAGAGANLKSSAEYLNARKDLLLLKAEQQEESRYLRPKHPKMVALSEEITRRERLLNFYQSESAAELENRKKVLALEITNGETAVAQQEAVVMEINQKTAEFHRLQANSDRIQVLYDKLLATMQTLDVNKEVSPESVTILENASDPEHLMPKTTEKVLVGGMLGFGLCIMLLLLSNRLDDRMNSVTELQELFDEPILGQIPREISTAPTRELAPIVPEDRRHMFVEAFRNLRSYLLFMGNPGERAKTILFTSSVPNEGKSLTACNLAITMANAGSRVLLVDADLRKGTLHNRLQMPAEPGLTEVLSKGFKWMEAVRPTHVANLFFLSRGAITYNSSEYFIGDVTRQFLRDAALAYDYTILDAAPVMAADDVPSLAPHIDGVVFVVRAEHTSAQVARAALDLLYQRQVRVIGLVFNAVHPSNGYYYYKYMDYYKPYSSEDAGASRQHAEN